MPYPYDQVFAADPSNPDNVASNGVVTIFAPGDAERVPLAITTLDGLPLPNPLQVNDAGFGPAFMHDTLDQVAWAGGGFSGLFVSYKGIKDEAIAARVAAQEAATAAEKSAADSTAPTGEAVGREISRPGSVANRAVTSTAAEAARLATTPFVNDISGLLRDTEPMAYLDNVSLLCQFPVREEGEKSWIQGCSINSEASEIYVSNQVGSELRIDVRNLQTGVRKSSRTVATEDQAFSESIDWFYRDGDLCFLVWPKAISFPNAYAIFNYTKNVLSPEIPIKGLVRGSRQGDRYVTSDAWGTAPPKRFYVYEWGSLTAGTPRLIDTIAAENRGGTAAKNQGIAAVGSKIFFTQGNQQESPTLSIYSADGSFQEVRVYERAAFRDALNMLSPGILATDDYLYEAEGAYNLAGKLVTSHVVNDAGQDTAAGQVVILQHNQPGGVRISSTPGNTLARDTGWIPLALNAGWTTGGTVAPSYRRIGGVVHLRGNILNGNSIGNEYAVFATLPPEVRPPGSLAFPSGSNTTALMAFRINPNGTMESWTSVPTSAWRPLSTVSWFLD